MALEEARDVVGAGALLEYLADGSPMTRAQMVRISGLARATVSHRLDALMAAGYVVLEKAPTGSRGRPAEVLRLNPSRGFLLAADVGGSHTRLGLADLTGTMVSRLDVDISVDEGPEAVLSTVDAGFVQLLSGRALHAADVLGIGVGMPGPVDYSTGRLARAPTMNGWDGLSVREHLAQSIDAPMQVDKDANIIALGVHRVLNPRRDDALVVKVGMGVGAGIISGGAIIRGAAGAAGDLGHIPRQGGALCRCGQYGCAEATAGGWAIAARLREAGHAQVRTSADIVALAAVRDPLAIDLLRAAGQRIGEVVAEALGVLNPGIVIIGGNLAEAEEPLMAGVRERVYQRSHPLASRELQIVSSPLGAEAGIRGAAYLASDLAIAPAHVDAVLRN